jgi:hypothetical protein
MTLSKPRSAGRWNYTKTTLPRRAKGALGARGGGCLALTVRRWDSSARHDTAHA